MVEKQKIDSKRLYACCPKCGKVIAQAEGMKNAIIRCEGCHYRVLVEIADEKVLTTLYQKSD